jgi:hypothetical protein
VLFDEPVVPRRITMLAERLEVGRPLGSATHRGVDMIKREFVADSAFETAAPISIIDPTSERVRNLPACQAQWF